MTDNRLIAGAVAGILGVVVAIAVVFLGGFLATDSTPASSVDKISSDNGFIKGSADYGTRGGSGATN